MDVGLMVTFAGVVVAGLAAILGVWMERDPKAPAKSGYLFTGLIVIATCVELSHAMAATAEQNETDAKLARVLERMADLAASGNNPALEQFVGAELAVQARANPDVVKKMEASIEEKGGDPKAVLKKASEGRRQAAGLPKKAPEPGEKPKLGAAFAGVKAGGGKKGAKAKAIAPAEAIGEDLAGALTGAGADLAGGMGGAASLGDAKGEAAKAMGDAKGSATKAMNDAKGSATKAVGNAKADADKADADAKAAAEAEAEKAKKEAEAAKKAAEDKKKQANDAKDKAKGLFKK